VLVAFGASAKLNETTAGENRPFSIFSLFLRVCMTLEEVNRTTMVKLGNGQFNRPNVPIGMQI
jgi:hypothetical protein